MVYIRAPWRNSLRYICVKHKVQLLCGCISVFWMVIMVLYTTSSFSHFWVGGIPFAGLVRHAVLIGYLRCDIVHVL